jgi:hypothetical protein
LKKVIVMGKRTVWPLIATVVVFQAACSSDDGSGTIVPTDPAVVTVTGEVTHKDDQVPVDGGVTMTLELDDGGIETLLFGSLFSHPPPSQEQLDLYRVIASVNVGDRVTAKGQRSEEGVSLEQLVILARQ